MARLFFLTFALACAPGCLTLYSKTDVVRSDEGRRPVVFECPQASEDFNAGLHDHSDTMSETVFGIPFITLYARRQELSDAAAWNDAAVRCDTNQDGVISSEEAKTFKKNRGD